MSKCSILKIDWLDHTTTHGGWQYADNPDALPMLIQSVGFLIREEPTHYVIAETLDDNVRPQTGALRSIIKGDVQRVEILGEL